MHPLHSTVVVIIIIISTIIVIIIIVIIIIKVMIVESMVDVCDDSQSRALNIYPTSHARIAGSKSNF